MHKLIILSIALFVFFSHTMTVVSALDKNHNRMIDDKTEKAENYFIENKGQIGDQYGKPNTSVKYLILRPGLNIQLKSNSFSYDAYTIERFNRLERIENTSHHKGDKCDDDSMVYHFSRVDIELENANPAPLITNQGSSNDYLNFYTHITSLTKGDEGATKVKGYSTITYHDIYPNIDLEWFLDKDGKPEYQFIINPGGDPSRIRLKYHGAKKTELISDAIHIHIKPGIIKESIPISYLAGSKEEIDVEYIQLGENEYGFTMPNYTTHETLIIDPVPNRLWGTYIGGNQNVYTNEIVLNTASEIYAVGSTTSSIAIATTGTHQSIISGDWDVYVNKFTSNAIRIWGTYYGGDQIDYGNTIALDGASNIYCGGLTFSASGISTSGAHQVDRNGNNDGIIAKFNSQGIRQWGTYYGGSVSESVHDISIDESDDLYIAGMSNSSNNISTSGAFQTTFSGNQDLFLLKLTQSGSRIWCTYYGGALEESIPRVSERSGNIILVGKAWSDNLGSSGSHQPNRSGYYDGIIVKFNTSGGRIWASYYGGVEYDDIVGVAQNQNGTIFIAGSTESETGVATTGVFQTTYGGGDVYGDAFVSSFSQSGSRLWGSYYGGSDDDLGKGVHCDQNGNVFIIGQSSSVSGIASSGSYQETYGLYKDVFFVKLNSNGQRVYGSYYGGPEDDDGSNILYFNNSLYLCGITWSSGIFGSVGTHQPDITGYQIYNGFISKFDDSGTQNVQTISTNVNSVQFCEQGKPSVTYTVSGTFNSPNTFTVQLSNASGSFANPTVIGNLNSTTSGTIQCQIPVNVPPGSGYRIRVASSNPVIIGSDNGTNIVINALPQPSISGSTSACEGSLTYAYTVPNVLGHTYLWTAPSKGIIIGSTTGNTVSIRWTTAGVDSVKIRQTNTQTSCYKDTTIIVTIQSSPNPIISGAVSACQQSQNNSYSIVNIPGHLYQWYAPTRGVITGSGTSNTINVQWTIAGIDSIKVRQTNPQTGCFKDTSMIVTIQALPMPLINGRTSVCATNKDESYSVAFVQGHNYQWFTPSKGKITSTLTSNTLTMQWTISGIDSLKVRQTNPLTGCYKDTMLMVTINELPQSTITGIAKACALSKTSQYSVPLKSNYTYQWGSITKGNIVGSTKENTVEVFWTNPGIDSVKVRTTNSLTGCFKDTSIIVTIMNNTTPTVSYFGNENFLCTGDSRGLACDIEADSYQWKRNGEIINGATLRQFIAFKNGSYNVITKLGNCESESQTKDIIEYEKPIPVIEGDRETVLSLISQTYSVGNANIKRHVWSASENAMIVDSNSTSIVNVKFLKTGPSIIYIWQESLQGCVGVDSIIVMVKSPSGISTNNQSSSVPYTIYPNPTGDANQIILQFSEAQKEHIDIELLDILGNQMYMSSLNIGDQSTTIPIHNLSSGMYMIRIHMNNEVYMEKVIVN